jgi:hypothetical protein
MATGPSSQGPACAFLGQGPQNPTGAGGEASRRVAAGREMKTRRGWLNEHRTPTKGPPNEYARRSERSVPLAAGPGSVPVFGAWTRVGASPRRPLRQRRRPTAGPIVFSGSVLARCSVRARGRGSSAVWLLEPVGGRDHGAWGRGGRFDPHVLNDLALSLQPRPGGAEVCGRDGASDRRAPIWGGPNGLNRRQPAGTAELARPAARARPLPLAGSAVLASVRGWPGADSSATGQTS